VRGCGSVCVFSVAHSRAERSAAYVYGLNGSKLDVRGPDLVGKDSVTGAAASSCSRAEGGRMILSAGSSMWLLAMVSEADQVRVGVESSVDMSVGERKARE